MRWDGGQPAIRLAGQPPAAVMDGPMVGPAQQDQIGQVGGAAVQPVPQMMTLTPGQRPLAVREEAAAVAHGQGGPLGRGDDPGRPAQVQRLARGSTQDGGAWLWRPGAAPPTPVTVGPGVVGGSLP